MLLTDFFDTVYVPLRLRGKSINSVRLYRLCIRQLGRTLGRPATVDDLTEQNVLDHLTRRSTVAPATRNKELTQLLAMWRLATQRKLLDTWPDIRSEPEPERDPIAWLPDELAALLTAIDKQTGTVAGIPANRWWSGLCRVILDTGERIGAVMAAEWSWLQVDWLRIPAEHRKGKTRDRSYRLSSATQSALGGIREYSATGQIFAWDRDRNYLWQCYAKIVASAGLPTGRKYQFHALRKTVGSVVYAAGLDPQDTLDHSDRRTTQRYLDPRFAKKTQTCDVLAEYLSMPQRKLKKDAG